MELEEQERERAQAEVKRYHNRDSPIHYERIDESVAFGFSGTELVSDLLRVMPYLDFISAVPGA